MRCQDWKWRRTETYLRFRPHFRTTSDYPKTQNGRQPQRPPSPPISNSLSQFTSAFYQLPPSASPLLFPCSTGAQCHFHSVIFPNSASKPCLNKAPALKARIPAPFLLGASGCMKSPQISPSPAILWGLLVLNSPSWQDKGIENVLSVPKTWQRPSANWLVIKRGESIYLKETQTSPHSSNLSL